VCGCGRIERAHRHQFLHLGDAELGRRCHHRIEITRGLAIDEIAGVVALPRLDQRQVAHQAALHDIFLAVEDLGLLAFGDQSADAGLGVESGNAGAAGAAAFRERTLRIEFQFELSGQVELGEGLILADIGRDHFLDLPGFEQQPQPGAVDAGIVADAGETCHAAVTHGADQLVGNADQAEAAAHHHQPSHRTPSSADLASV